jgi:soluble lytic murein transglycosylase-like protein
LSTAAACLLFVSPHTDCDAPTRLKYTETTNRTVRWNQFIAEASRRFVVPEDWIRVVIDAESGGHNMLDGKPITSPKGAMGLMQLMPGTWKDMRRRYGLGDDPYDPHDNILAGTAYLGGLIDRFGIGAFAAYNTGPGRFTAYLDGGQSLPAETQKYLARIALSVPEVAISAPHQMLFFVNSAAPNSANSGAVTTVSAHDLFVPLSGAAP